eukprot:CAMPEP_0175154342 /NCGR_PEP_ID=MMETSP0087-20121206/20281_1 /TAXON_ID=136419 /ORGANISM="Unknown Unknown, Strain D1" /LENGTH=373 /DNA_ID=CAMNT_0016441205 /DNA_START=71 /DNA_END=1189 /DNA_ORIENTATION=-
MVPISPALTALLRVCNKEAKPIDTSDSENESSAGHRPLTGMSILQLNKRAQPLSIKRQKHGEEDLSTTCTVCENFCDDSDLAFCTNVTVAAGKCIKRYCESCLVKYYKEPHLPPKHRWKCPDCQGISPKVPTPKRTPAPPPLLEQTEGSTSRDIPPIQSTTIHTMLMHTNNQPVTDNTTGSPSLSAPYPKSHPITPPQAAAAAVAAVVSAPPTPPPSQSRAVDSSPLSSLVTIASCSPRLAPKTTPPSLKHLRVAVASRGSVEQSADIKRQRKRPREHDSLSSLLPSSSSSAAPDPFLMLASSLFAGGAPAAPFDPTDSSNSAFIAAGALFSDGACSVETILHTLGLFAAVSLMPPIQKKIQLCLKSTDKTDW